MVLGGAGRSKDQDANDPRQDTQHAKAINTEDITAKDNNAKDTSDATRDFGFTPFMTIPFLPLF